MSNQGTFSRPNLFRLATSELSQDAVVGWLLAWADARCGGLDAELHTLGGELLAAMLAKAGVPTPARGSVHVIRQWNGAGRSVSGALDLLVEVGDEHLLAIEDKTDTQDHSAQLERYAAALGARYPNRTRALIYLKTGDQASYDSVVERGWVPFLRTDLLGVLRGHGGSRNDVVREFRAYLEGIEDEVDSWRTIPQERDWSDRAWSGFYMAVREGLGEGEWKYVNNPSGGFMGLHFGWRNVEGGNLFLHLEEEALVLKIEVLGSNKSTLRDHWSKRVLTHADGDGFVRPDRFGHGEYMTVARLATSYRVAGADGRVDVGATIRRLERLVAFVDTLSRE